MTPFTPSLAQLIDRIQARQGYWIGFEGELKLEFVTAQNQTASCRGELKYHRFAEKVMLRCFDEHRQLLFAFKTDDRMFEMYLPSSKTLYRGDALDLEDDPEIESHLKPLQLYRALKTAAIPMEQSVIEAWGEHTVTLKIYGKNHNQSYLLRRLLSTMQGDVQQETYYNFKEQAVLTILRSNYRAVKERRMDHTPSMIFPFQIRMETKATGSKTSLRFQKIKPRSFFSNQEWLLEVPSDTKFSEVAAGPKEA